MAKTSSSAKTGVPGGQSMLSSNENKTKTSAAKIAELKTKAE